MFAHLVPSVSPDLIDENDIDFHSIATADHIASAMDCKQPVLQRPLRGLSSIEPALDLMATTDLLLDLKAEPDIMQPPPQHQHQHQHAQKQHPQKLQLQPLPDLGDVFIELQLPLLAHCTDRDVASSALDAAAAAAAAAAAPRIDSISPQSAAPAYPTIDDDMVQRFEEFLSSSDDYSSDSSGGEQGMTVDGTAAPYSTAYSTTTPSPSPPPSWSAAALPPTINRCAATTKGGAARVSARTKAARRTTRTTKGSASTASKLTASSSSPTAYSSASSVFSATSAAALAAAQKRPRKGWKCSCAFLVASITVRERAKLLKVGVTAPPIGTDPATLTKVQERELRGAIRKIRNVASAQKSRRNQKDYIAALEKEAADRECAIQSLEGEVDTLADTNKTLLSQLGELRSLFYGSSTAVARASAAAAAATTTVGNGVGSGAGGTALLMLAVCCGVGLSSHDPSTAASTAAAAAGFGFDLGLGMAAIGKQSDENNGNIYYTTNISGDGGDDQAAPAAGGVFTPTGFRSRTLQSFEDATASPAVGSDGTAWMLANVALAAVVVVAALVAIVTVAARKQMRQQQSDEAVQPGDGVAAAAAPGKVAAKIAATPLVHRGPAGDCTGSETVGS